MFFHAYAVFMLNTCKMIFIEEFFFSNLIMEKYSNDKLQNQLHKKKLRFIILGLKSLPASVMYILAFLVRWIANKTVNDELIEVW